MKMLFGGKSLHGDRAAIGRSAAPSAIFTDEARGGGRRPHSPEVYRRGLFLTLVLLAVPAAAQVQVQFGGTAGFGSSDPYSVGDAYASASLKVGSALHLYSESLYALRRSRQGFSGTGVSLQLDVDSGYFGAGLGSYGWRGTGTRLFIGWPTGPHQTFELSYTRLRTGGPTDPVFTYGVRF